MAKKDIYRSRKQYIIETRQLKNTEKMVDLAVKLGRQVNQRFYRLEKANRGIGDTAYRYAQLETDKEKPRYTTSRNILSKMTDKELYEHLLQLNSKIISLTSTIEGLNVVENNRLSESARVLSRISGLEDITARDIKKLVDSGGEVLLNNLNLDSGTVVRKWKNYVKNGNLSTKEFIREFTRFKSLEDVDIKKIERNLNRLSIRKNRKKRK